MPSDVLDPETTPKRNAQPKGHFSGNSCVTLPGGLSSNELPNHTGMSMVLSKWIVTPIKVGWISPVNR